MEQVRVNPEEVRTNSPVWNKLTVTVPEAAELCNVSTRTMYELIHSKGFPVIWFGRKAVVSVEGLTNWLRKQAGMEEMQ